MRFSTGCGECVPFTELIANVENTNCTGSCPRYPPESLNPYKLWFFIPGVGAPLHIRPVQCCRCLCSVNWCPAYVVAVSSELSAYSPNLMQSQ